MEISTSMSNTPGSTTLNWLSNVLAYFLPKPKNRTDLLNILREAHKGNIIDNEELAMIEGVLEVSEIRVEDIMIPRSQMAVIDLNQPREKYLQDVIESGHSRFPVLGDDREKIIGVLHAKDILRLGN